MDFIYDAESFIRQLRGTRDDNPRVQQQRLELVSLTEAFVTAWRTFDRVHFNGPTPRPAFEYVLENLKNDNRRLVADLRQRLEDATYATKRDRKRTLLCFTRRPTGILVNFFGLGKTRLRQKQILYAAAVVNLITYIVIHVKNHEYVDSEDEEWFTIRKDQMETIQKQKDALKALHEQEQQFRDDLVYPRKWLGEFEGTAEPDHLPFEVVASMWFDDILSINSMTGPSGGRQDPLVKQILRHMQVQQQRADATIRDLEERWNIQFNDHKTAWQTLEDKLNIQKATLEQELRDVKREKATLKQEKEKLKQEMERLRSGVTGAGSEVLEAEDIDEDVLNIEVKQEILDAERRGLDEEKSVFEGQGRVSDKKSTVSSRPSQRTFEVSNHTTDVAPALKSARARASLPIQQLTGVPNRNRYPPQASVKLGTSKRRDSKPYTQPRNSSRERRSSFLATDTTPINRILASNLQDSRNIGNVRLKSSSRTVSRNAGITTRDPRVSDNFQNAHQGFHQADYEHSRRKGARDRSSSAERGYENPYQTLPSQRYEGFNSAGHKTFLPRTDTTDKQYNSQLSSGVLRYPPQTTQQVDPQSQRKDSTQKSNSVRIGRTARV